MGVTTPELIGQVVSKVGDLLSVMIGGTTYNTRLKTLFKIGDKVRATFEGGSRTIIAIRLIMPSDENDADDIFDEFVTNDDTAIYCEIEWAECYIDDETEEITCMIRDMTE